MGGDVEVAPDELLAELLRAVLGQIQVEQRARPGEAPVDGQAVEELDVADARAAALPLLQADEGRSI
ncbi:hypothetical protein GCM10020000_44020 [Streptomyces olivoverticillatus]